MHYLVLGIIVILAVLLDMLLMQGWHRRLEKSETQDTNGKVFLWGRYSPLLTWLGKQFARARSSLGARSRAVQRDGSAPGPAPAEGRPVSGSEVMLPGGILAAGGAVLAIAGWVLASLIEQPLIKSDRLPKDIHTLLWIVALWGLVFLTAGVFILVMNRLPGWLDRFVKSTGRWLGVQPWQVFCLLLSPFFSIFPAMLGSGVQSRLTYPGLAIIFWLVGIGLAVAGSLGRLARGRPSWPVWILFTALVAFALIVRAVDNTHITATLTGDEGAAGLSSIAFREGRVNNIFSAGYRGFPMLYFFMQSLPIAAFGRTVAALRISSALAGALTVGAVFLTGSALFGRRAGLFAAIFLAALHYHIHFSRIGLNNIWDGLFFTSVAGALWAGWQTGRRGYYVLAGISLGLAQYFYLTSRVLVILVAAWLFLALVFTVRRERWRIKSALPGLALMALIAVVIVLPLGCYYARYPSEFAGSTNQQSIFGSWMDTARQATGKSEIRIVFDQIQLGFHGYVSAPLKWFYRPNVPVLRQVPAAIFVLGLFLLILRPRDLRVYLLGLWLIAIGLVGGLSESTPAAQRYVAAAPACALVLGFAVSRLTSLLASLLPRLKVGVGAAALLFVALLAADDLRFYFTEYAPNSYFRGKYDFEGYGSAVTMRLARYLRGYGGEAFVPDDWQVMFFGPPRLRFYAIASMLYLVPSIRGVDVPLPWGELNNPKPKTPNLIYVFLPDRQADLAAAQQAYPGGRLVTELDDRGDILYSLYQVPPDPASQPRVAVEGKFGIFQPTFVWAFVCLALAGLAIAWLRRVKPDWCWLGAETEEMGLISPMETSQPAPKPYLTLMTDTRTDSSISDSLDPQEKPAPSAGSIIPSPAGSQTGDGTPTPDGSPAAVEIVPLIPVISTLEGAPPGESPIPAHTARVNISVEVPEGMTVQVTVSSAAAGQAPTVSQRVYSGSVGTVALPAPKQPSALKLRPALSLAIGKLYLLPVHVFWLAMLVYLVTRFVGLERWPIYFFTDEAVQTVMASDFVHQDFKNYDRESWPTYFNNGSTFNLSSVSVYVQVIPYLLFGKSVLVTRGVSVLIGALAALSVAFILRDAFKIRFWWSGVLLLLITPAWFLHSRTAFETVELTALYALFLLFYMMYRHRDPRYLFPSLFFGALVFYTYSPGALIMGVSGVLLLISDLPYHWKHKKYALLGLLFLGLLALPYLRYVQAHPGVTKAQLCTRATYWCEPGSLVNKLGQYLNEYKRGFSLSYWYIPNRYDLDRHLMKGYGHTLWFTAPFMLIGLAACLWKFHISSYRMVLAALVAAPAGSALVQIGITRTLVMVVPITILTAIGLEKVLEFMIDPDGQLRAIRPPGFLAWFGKAGQALAEQPLFGNPPAHWRESPRLSPRLAGVLLFLVLAVVSGYMLGDALLNGPTWFQQYDMGGMQYGAIPLFQQVKQYAEEHPDLRVMVSPDWANGTDVIARFFLSDPLPIDLGSFKGYEYRFNPDIDRRAFVLIPAEWEALRSSNKFTNIQVDQILNYPNGKPGFYFVRAQYAGDVEQILEDEIAARHRPQEAKVTIGSELVDVKYSYLDMGTIDNLFDGSKQTLARTMEANPFAIEIDFSVARQVGGIVATVGSMEAEITVRVTTQDGQVKEYRTVFRASPENLTTQIDFEEPWSVRSLHIEIRNMNAGEPANVHVSEIELK
jgi:4-amino-4-deoxy-L-arabinose transferase-like glycosyltransferase